MIMSAWRHEPARLASHWHRIGGIDHGRLWVMMMMMIHAALMHAAVARAAHLADADADAATIHAVVDVVVAGSGRVAVLGRPTRTLAHALAAHARKSACDRSAQIDLGTFSFTHGLVLFLIPSSSCLISLSIFVVVVVVVSLFGCFLVAYLYPLYFLYLFFVVVASLNS